MQSSRPVVALLTRKQAAEVLGVSERSLGRHSDELASMGQTVTVGRRTKYKRAGLEAAWLKVSRPQPANVARLEAIARQAADDTPQADDADDAPDDDAASYHVSRARREAANAEIQEMQLERMRGQLVSVDQVARDWGEAYRATREALERIPVQVAPEVKRCAGDIGGIQLLLQRKIAEVLTKLSNDGDRLMQETIRKEMAEAAK